MTRFKKLSDFSQSLNEDNLSGLGNAHPWQEIERMGIRLIKGEPIQLTANLFGTGLDTIDTNSTAFQDAIQLMRWLFIQAYTSQNLADSALVVRGSASAVGSTSGYDNFALASRRANHLIEALKKWFNANKPKTEVSPENTLEVGWSSIEKYIKITKDAIVGNATRKGSAEALAEQCVYLIWVPIGKEKTFNYELVQPIDNTAVVIPKIIKEPIKNLPEFEFGDAIRCGCCGRDFTEKDKNSWVIDRYKWSLNELKNGWLKNKTGQIVWEWLVNMSGR